MHLPKHSLLFGILLFLTLALTGYLFPPEGLKLGKLANLHFPSPLALFNPETQAADISKVLKAIEAVDTNYVPSIPAANTDSIATADTLKTEVPELITEPDKSGAEHSLHEEKNKTKPEELPKQENGVSHIQYKNKHVLSAFFKALKQVKNEKSSVRILHYGDSQIEGDRMSDYLRLKLQSQFGGRGPGLVSVMPLSRSVINRIEWSENWDRYGAYTARDKRVKHNNFGVLAGFCKFHAGKKTNSAHPVLSASVGIVTTPNGGSQALNFERIKLFYGGSKHKTWCEFYEGPVLMNADSLEAEGNFRVKEYRIVSGNNKHSFKFRGLESPDFYALSLEGEGGVMVDNIALRGSSGTFFQHLNLQQLKLFYEYLNVKLIILQFGGNAIPSLEDESMAVNYGNYLRYQISLVKKAAPGVSLLFIGPSDMNIKEGTDYVSYPLLEKIRDEIRKAVLESGSAFYDLYEAMGGRNSMAQWVKQGLAAGDYTHFSPQGARKMSTLLYAELMKEYQNYLNNENTYHAN